MVLTDWTNSSLHTLSRVPRISIVRIVLSTGEFCEMTILVDMDDTIEYLLVAWIHCLNKLYHKNVEYNDSVSWDVSEAYPDLTHEQVYSVLEIPGFWKTVKPIPGAAEALQHLMGAGHNIYIVTASSYESIAEKMKDLLFVYFPFLSWNQVIVTSNKQMIKGDILIDDGVHNLEGGDYIKILMTAPHNREYDAEANGMIRVHSWLDIERVIQSLENNY